MTPTIFDLSSQAGQQLTSITVDSYTFSPSDPGVSFFAFTAGTSFTGQGGGDIDGSVFINAASGEVLDDLGGSLGPGDYSFWVQETSTNVVDYQLTFTVVPEPTGMAALGLMMIAVVSRRRR